MADIVRVRIFVDFWNFQINWNKCHAKMGAATTMQIPWKELPQVLTAEAAAGQASKYAGCQVYASIDEDNAKDTGLSKWLHHGLASFPGYAVEVKKRKLKAPVKCQECKTELTTCTACKKPIRQTSEKGIDAAIITDLISMAFDDNYDIAVLVSGDADYAPAVQYIQKKTDKQIVQAFFKAHGDQLRTACWSHMFFEDLFAKLNVVPITTVAVAAKAPEKK
jgi:uncharacterized LabA/DUF88 family protein